MIAVDTSVVIAGLLHDHAQHELAWPVMASAPAIPAQAALESYSVLTRLPLPGRVPPASAAQLLARAFGGRLLGLSGEEYEALVAEMPQVGIGGGAIYDAVIAATARKHHLVLHSLDQRAEATYQAIGVEYQMI